MNEEEEEEDEEEEGGGEEMVDVVDPVNISQSCKTLFPSNPVESSWSATVSCLCVQPT